MFCSYFDKKHFVLTSGYWKKFVFSFYNLPNPESTELPRDIFISSELIENMQNKKFDCNGMCFESMGAIAGLKHKYTIYIQYVHIIHTIWMRMINWIND